MLNLKKIIENIFKIKNVKFIFMVFLICFSFSWLTYADCGELTSVDSTVSIVYKIISILSRLWIIIANIVWKFITNDVVYWAFLNLDGTLWTFWNIMKNIANFTLWVLVLVSIILNIFSTWNSKKFKPIDIIKKTAIAWILIQMSWFLMWLAIDLSTICTSVVASFPAQFISSSNEIQRDLRKNMTKIVGNEVTINYDNECNPVVLKKKDTTLTDDDVNSLLDTLMPSTDQMAWPLLYMWFSIFDFYDFWVQDVVEWQSRSNLILTVWLDCIVFVAYTVMLLLMLIFCLIRVILLWLIIPSMPLIILVSVFKFKLSKFLWEITNIKNIFMLIFKPVILTLAIWVVMIVLILIKWIINTDSTNITFEDENLSIINEQNLDGTYNTSMDVDWFVNVAVNWVKNSFADIIVFILWLCLVYFLLKLSTVKTGISFLDKKLDNIFKAAWNIVTNMPIIPIPWWDPISINNINNTISRDDLLTVRAGINSSEQEERVRKYLHLEDSFDSLYPTMTRSEFIAKSKELINQYDITNNIRNKDILQKKIDEWNSKHPNTNELITINKDILWDWSDNSTKPTTAQESSQTWD